MPACMTPLVAAANFAAAAASCLLSPRNTFAAASILAFRLITVYVWQAGKGERERERKREKERERERERDQ
jgi:hypothetical protein